MGNHLGGDLSAQSPARMNQCHIPCDMCELKKRKKFEPTSTAVPAASAASIALTEVMPLLPSGVGQSLASIMRTGLTSHHIGLVFTRLLSTR